jgi:hypothetical protein
MYKHSENTIDPRDTNLITYSKESKKFIVEASSLKANDISPELHYYTIGGNKWIIFLWSEKYQLHICYRHQRQVKQNEEVIADVFAPYFGILTGGNDSKAHTASLGTELHILND